MAGGPVRNIAIVRALGGLGDFLCATAALTSIRQAYPEARITYIGLPQTEPLIARYPQLIDRFLCFPGFPGIVEYPFATERLIAFLDDLRGTPRFDLAIQMHGNGSVMNSFTAMLGARDMVGYHLAGLWRPEPRLFLDYAPGMHEVERWRRLATALTGDAGPRDTCFPVSDADRDEAAALCEGREYAIVHAGSSSPATRWPADRFAAVADRLAEYGLTVLLTGTPAEADIAASIEDRMTGYAINLAGKTALGPMAALVESAQLVVCNDTGVSHLAAALRTPSVIIFIASDRDRWAPLDARRHRAIGPGLPDPVVGDASSPRPTEMPGIAEVNAAVDQQLLMVAR